MGKKSNRRKKILILSNDGACRGVMASAYLARKLRELGLARRLVIQSGGVMAHPDYPLDPKAAVLLKREGLEMDGYRPASLSERLLRRLDLILACSEENKNYLRNLFPDCRVPIRVLGIAPIIDGREETYESCFREIQKRLDEEVEKSLSDL